MSLFLRLLEADDKAATLRDAVQVARSGQPDARVFDVDPEGFRQVPASPFAYWAPERFLQLFTKRAPFSIAPRLVVSTNPLNADFRFVRLWWETAPSTLGHSWKPWAKGGAYSPHYSDVSTVIAWSEGRESYNGFLGTENRPLERPASVQHFLRPGLTWPRRTNSGLSMRAMPAGCIFADKGPAAFVEDDDPEALLAMLAIANSRPFAALVELQLAAADAAARSYEVGVLQRTPIPPLTTDDDQPTTKYHLAELAHRAWSLKRSLDTPTENSHAFILPALLQVEGDDLAERAAAWSRRVAETESELAQIQAEIDRPLLRPLRYRRRGPPADQARIRGAG